MIEGLRLIEKKSSSLQIPFVLLIGEPAREIPNFIESTAASTIITDFDPLRTKKNWKHEVIEKIQIPIYEVDSHNIVPCWIASTKQEYAAYTLRPKINKILNIYLEEFPNPEKMPYKVNEWGNPPNWDKALNLIPEDAKKPITVQKSGSENAKIILHEFIKNRLSKYSEARNDPNLEGQSKLSPYLHFGQLSSQRVALEVKASSSTIIDKEAYLEELIVRKELSDNFVNYNDDYDTIQSLPDWSKRTLDEHRGDRREYTYKLSELERAETHDDLWNAAQNQMLRTGTMHGYMRMYWAKKILEWSATPEEAFEAAIILNDRYELDGRDPNGYAGIAWSLGGLHDRAWGERPIFGKIRYMSYNGCRSKFDVNEYVKKFS
jgi:deoxyribodipyrimidine photo-lyase